MFPRLESKLEQILDYLHSQGKIDQAQDIYLPLVDQIIRWKQEVDRPLIQGIVGGQGTGKTTLCRLLQKILEIAGYATISLSLDDLYKTYSERQELQRKEPRLCWRGPPGTHDIQLGIDILEQIRTSTTLSDHTSITLPDYLNNPRQVIALPRFDKSLWDGMGDRTTPELVEIPDILLFEGWFVGVLPRVHLENWGDFTAYINQQLHDYLPLWEKLDKLILLYPEDYRFCLQWRLQAEQEMIALSKDKRKDDLKKGMTPAEITSFVEYFWQALPPELFISPLTKVPTPVDLVISIDSDHRLGKLYSPKEP